MLDTEPIIFQDFIETIHSVLFFIDIAACVQDYSQVMYTIYRFLWVNGGNTCVTLD